MACRGRARRDERGRGARRRRHPAHASGTRPVVRGRHRLDRPRRGHRSTSPRMANATDTLVVLMAAGKLARTCAALIDAGRPSCTPAAIVQWAIDRRPAHRRRHARRPADPRARCQRRPPGHAGGGRRRLARPWRGAARPHRRARRLSSVSRSPSCRYRSRRCSAGSSPSPTRRRWGAGPRDPACRP